ncbi:MAG: HAAS signaling domain-containing protein [Spirochaetia bacterium]
MDEKTKLIEQYVTAVSYKLPLGRRKDIKDELRSLLMDELEDRFGPDAGVKEAETVIRDFGSPAETAARYRGGGRLIAESLHDIYFTLLKIVLFALSIAFTIIFVLKLVTENPTGTDLLIEILRVPGGIIQGWLSAVGLITLIFIVVTRKFGDKVGEKPLLDTSWSIDDIRDIELEQERPSTAGTVISITGGGIFAVLAVAYPEIISLFENLFEVSTIGLGHHINTEMFRRFGFGILALWIGSSVIELMMLRRGEKTEPLKRGEGIINALEAVLFIVMAVTPGLYRSAAERTAASGITIQAPDPIGFRLIFLLIALVSLGETIAWVVKRIRDR